jgi:hypothetical protein
LLETCRKYALLKPPPGYKLEQAPQPGRFVGDLHRESRAIPSRFQEIMPFRRPIGALISGCRHNHLISKMTVDEDS